MIWWAGVPFLAAGLARLTGASVARRLPPALATCLVTGAALTISLTCGLILSAGAIISAAQLPVAGRIGHWSTHVVRHIGGLPAYPGYAAAALVAVLLVLAGRQVIHAARVERSAFGLVRGLARPHSALVIVPDSVPTAYAVGLFKARIIVSTGMLAHLSADERRVLLAHEAAHVRQHHQLFVQLTALAAAANPLLRPLVPAVQTAIERWADESAAREVGSRRLVASSLLRAASVQSHRPSPASGLAVAEADIALRVRALLRPASSVPWRLALTVTAIALSCWVISVQVVLRVHDLIEVAELHYLR